MRACIWTFNFLQTPVTLLSLRARNILQENKQQKKTKVLVLLPFCCIYTDKSLKMAALESPNSSTSELQRQWGPNVRFK